MSMAEYKCVVRRVPTVDGDKTLTVREGTQSGDRLRMRGYGVPTLGGRGRGDQYVHVKCVSGERSMSAASFQSYHGGRLRSTKILRTGPNDQY